MTRRPDATASAPSLPHAQGQPERSRGSSENASGPRRNAGTDDPDMHKGAVEGDRPDQPQNANPHGSGVNDQGLPNDPVAIAEDEIGANEDESQG
jgi:hypothetical protein